MVPAVIQFLLITPGVETTDFSTLRALVYGASPITDKVLVAGMERFGCEFIQVYGLTETTGRDHAARRRRPRPRAPARSCCARAASRTRGWRCASSTPRPATT